MFCAWVGHILISNHKTREQVRAEIMEGYQRDLQAGMQLAQSYVNAEIPSLRTRAEQQLRSHMDQAWSLVENTVRAHPGIPRKELIHRVAETLRPLRYEQGKGYFFIISYDSVGILLPPNFKSLEGIKRASLEGQVQQVLAAHDSIVRNHGEGIYHYLWAKPGAPTGSYPKTSFIRGYDSLGIAIATGLYDEDIKSGIQEEILAQLGKMRFGHDAYFIAGDWDGMSLLGLGQRKNMLHMRDHYGTPIMKNLITLAKGGDGFLEYHMSTNGSPSVTHKLCYVIGIPEWRWFIAIVRDINGLESAIQERQQVVRKQLLQVVGISLAALLLILSVIVYLSHWMSYAIAKDLRHFMQFFRHAGHKLEAIPVESIQHAELRQIAQDANVMVESLRRNQSEREQILATLEAKNQELEHVLYIAGHDLRSPLLTIQGFTTELLQDLNTLTQDMGQNTTESQQRVSNLVSESIPASVDYIRSGINKLDYQLQGVLRYSRAGRIQPSSDLLRMDSLLAQCTHAMEYSLRSANATLDLSPLPDCYGDNTLTQQIFTNLIENALKYRHAERPPQISIRGHIQGPAATYCIEDNGIGIPEAELKNIFKLFNRTGQKTDAAGDGLGLAIAMRLALRMHGRVWAESTLHHGSRFYIALPARPRNDA
jgi:signal transduction histidine kinase